MSDLLSAPGPSVTRPERFFLKMLAEMATVDFTIPTIVNIGVWRGCTMHCLRAGSEDASLWGIDIDYARQIHKRDELQAVFIEADSSTYQFDFKVHLLFIDGDHGYDGARADIENWERRVVDGGIIAFHDYNPTVTDERRFKLSGVKQAVDEWMMDREVIGRVGSIIAVRK